MVVLPAWLDQVPDVDFQPEKELLTDLQTWAEANGWSVSDGAGLPSDLRRRTDVLLQKPPGDDYVRVSVLPRSRRGAGEIRLDASNLRTLELVYQRRQARWRVEAGAVPFEDDVLRFGWDRVLKLLFKP